MFATHYHELTELQQHHPGIVSYYAASRRTQQGIVFLYKMIRGVADGSFGVEVAKLAELPGSVILRSQELLVQLQAHGAGREVARLSKSQVDDSLVDEYERTLNDNKNLRETVKKLQKQVRGNEALISQIQGVDYDNLSPKLAFDLLWQLKNQE